ncbi:MAG: hypothetical protein AAGF75_04135, partial [Cyanobacteria bacterium P01_H01_bin.130]
MDLSMMFLAVPEVATAVGVRRQSVHELARRWAGGRKRQGVKGLEFPIAVMPSRYQPPCVAFWKKKEADRLAQLAQVADQDEVLFFEGAPQTPISHPAPGIGELRLGRSPGSQQRAVTLNARPVPVADCRLDLLRAMTEFVDEAIAEDPSLKKRRAEDFFEERYNSGAIQPRLPETRALYPKVSRASVKRWEKDLREGGYAALRDGRAGGRAGACSLGAGVGVGR